MAEDTGSRGFDLDGELFRLDLEDRLSSLHRFPWTFEPPTDPPFGHREPELGNDNDCGHPRHPSIISRSSGNLVTG